MSCCDCCVCIGGVNYTKACAACGANPLSMSTVNVNPSANQSVCGGDGGAGSLSSALNAIGKWGTALTGVMQGKAVQTGKSGVAVGAKGATGFGATMSPNSMLLILIIVGVLIFMATRH